MKEINKFGNAFTLVEILVAITIISLLSINALSYFYNFMDEKKIYTEMDLINNNIEILNNKVKNNEIYDYEINFSGNLFYTYRFNQLVSKSNISFLFDDVTKKIDLETNNSNTGTWDIKIYKENKLINNYLIDQRENFSGVINLYKNYEFRTYYDGKQDDLGIFYFSEDNLSENGIPMLFVEVNTKEDKSGNSSKDFYIKNINNQLKFFSGNNIWNENEVYIFFEKDGIEKSLKISNN